jgi:hypothetical protein
VSFIGCGEFVSFPDFSVFAWGEGAVAVFMGKGEKANETMGETAVKTSGDIQQASARTRAHTDTTALHPPPPHTHTHTHTITHIHFPDPSIHPAALFARQQPISDGQSPIISPPCTSARPCNSYLCFLGHRSIRKQSSPTDRCQGAGIYPRGRRRGIGRDRGGVPGAGDR